MGLLVNTYFKTNFMKQLTLLLLSLIVLAGCNSEKSRIENIDLQLTVERLDQELSVMVTDSSYQRLPALHEKYGELFEGLNIYVMRIGESTDALYPRFLQLFMRDTMVRNAYEKAGEVFADMQPLEAQLISAFKHVLFYFPDVPAPRIVTYISGFNDAVVSTDVAIGIGLDGFLGNDYELYAKLGKAAYLRYHMRPERIAPLCVEEWIAARYPMQQDIGATLLAKMIYEGKILYVLSKCLPEQPIAELVGFRPEQMQWCIDNERLMWQQLLEQQLLYNTSYPLIQKYTGDAPFTAGFSQESPGKAANWLGYRIVENYVKHTDCTLPELMEQHDVQQLLKEARYNPK